MSKYCEYCSHSLDSSFDCLSCIHLDRRPYADNTVMLEDLFILSPSIVSRKGTPEWIRKGDEKEKKMSKELVEIVRCKNCIHRPTFGEGIRSINPPEDSRGDEDYTCPCLNEDDPWYSWCPLDEWFCADGEAEGDDNE